MKPRRSSGFTLLELVATLVVATVLLGMCLPHLHGIFTHSADPVHRLEKTFKLQTVLENVVNDFESDEDLARVKSAIDAHTYPGDYTVVFNDYIAFDAANTEQADTGGQNRLLKVTLRNPSGEELTRLFAVD